ncbi:MAG: hypothetical protein IJN53_06365, partial [Oscillospiraceae bacterium]|nr:hypothetical protein [Oscillospiraceae bacterium]
MRKQTLRPLSILLALALVLSLAVAIAPLEAKAASGITEASGHLESAYVQWADVSGASGYNVYVKKSGGSYVQLDTELIRKYSGYWRADALGLAAGSYTMKIVPLVNGAEQADKVMETGTLTVLAHNRNGFAHSGNYTVGAYNNDGTLNANAVVLYVTDANKNTLTAEIPGRGKVTGLQTIITACEDSSAPVCIRIIGELGIPTKTSSGQIRIEGNAKGVTVEGVGNDATCNGWGFVLSECENVEIRNLGFMNNDSSEGDSITLEDVTHAWIHNCDFFYGEPGNEADKIKGDGALDTKASRYITHSYNHFWDCGKVNLQGSSSGDSSNYITYHHNWYDHSDSRHPRVRNASVHVYNNYYDGNAGYGIGAACDADVFVDSNYFRNCKYPMLISAQGSDTSKTMSGEPGGMIKAYGNVIVGATSYIPYTSGSTSFDAYEVSSRSATVPSSVSATNGGATYNNFDTASSFYNGSIDTAQAAVENVTSYAGRVGGGDFQWKFNNAVDDLSSAINNELKAALKAYETQLVSIGGNSVTTEQDPHTHSYTSEVTTAATCDSSGVKTFTCSCGASYTEAIPALGHSYSGGVCTRCGAEESDDPHTHSYSSKVTTAATCEKAGVKTFTCSCGDSYTQAIPALGHNYSGGVCTRCGAADPNYEAPVVPAGIYIHSFTDSALESRFYTFSGALATNTGKVTYNGVTLTQCLV